MLHKRWIVNENAYLDQKIAKKKLALRALLANRIEK